MATAAIPTKYNGVQFRSRIEAKWAAFMDLLGWSWEYEPMDFDGYIPDFLVEDMFWLEVKAAMTLDELEPEAPKVYKALRGCGRSALLVGGRPFYNGNTNGAVEYENENFKRMGLIVLDEYAAEPLIEDGEEYYLKMPERGWRDYALWQECDHYDFAPGGEYGSWANIMDICYASHDPDLDLLQSLWREASNITQWQPGRRAA